MAEQNDSWELIKYGVIAGKPIEIIVSKEPGIVEERDRILVSFSAWTDLEYILDPDYDCNRTDVGDELYQMLKTYGSVVIRKGDPTEVSFDRYGRPYLQVRNIEDFQHAIGALLYSAFEDHEIQ